MPKPRDRVRKILDWEELERAPNTHGALSFLKSAAEIVSIRKGDTPTRDELSNSTTVVDTTTVVRKPVVPGRRPAPRPCYLAQDGHSLGETALYQVLWARGKQETADTRIITAGWRTMKRLCGMSDKSCKRNARGLIEKFAMEVVDAENISTRTGRTYRIHSYVNILARRKTAGLEWVSRDRSRRFVQKDGSQLTNQEDFKTPESYPATVDELPGTNSTTVVAKTIGAMVDKTPVTVVAKTTVLGSTLGILKKEIPSTTTEVDLVVQALADQAGVADAAAANRLIAECRAACPSATTIEIIGILREKAFAARSRRDVRNLIGFLLSTVPPVFEGQGIVSYRRSIAAEVEAAHRKAEEQRKDQEEMRAYFVREMERLRALLPDRGLPEKKRLEVEKHVRECEDALKHYPTDVAEQTG